MSQSRRLPIDLWVRETFFGEAPVDIDFHAVDFDVPARSQIDHHIPMQTALVGVTGFGVTRADGKMHGSTDLFVDSVLRV